MAEHSVQDYERLVAGTAALAGSTLPDARVESVVLAGDFAHVRLVGENAKRVKALLEKIDGHWHVMGEEPYRPRRRSGWRLRGPRPGWRSPADPVPGRLPEMPGAG